MIGVAAPAKTAAMGVDRFTTWFEANREGLSIGLVVGAALVALMLILRSYGERTVRRNPDDLGWRAVIGRVLAKTSVLFMVLAAADVVSTYADLPHKAARLIDIAFTIAFALQGAVWCRELILGVIGRKVAEESGSGALANAMAIIRVLISVALFAIAAILILDNLGVNVTALVAGLGIGGIAFGIWSERIGRKRAIINASLLALPVLPLWAFTSTPLLLGIGAFLMQVAVQGAWGIVPVHLNELAPPGARALFPGFAYQLGNLIMSRNAVFQARIAESHGNDYGLALAIVGGAMAIVIVAWTAIGPERKSTDFRADEASSGST